MFKSHNSMDDSQSYLDFFSDSNILVEDMQMLRALLYFNLPYESIIKNQLKSEKLFHYTQN